ncbi:MAG: PAS domain-containing protein [Deltaproteobacteria bacterium]|nr:PAS domain-containing protein [Deltaproteobacteria bacterium]
MEVGLTIDQLRWAVQGSGLGVWQWDIASDTVTWSSEMGARFGVEEASFPRNVTEYGLLLHPDDREAVKRAIDSAIANRASAFSIEHRVQRPDG